jgi:Fic family protein
MLILDYQFSDNSKIKALLSEVKRQEKEIKSVSIPPKLFQKIFKRNYLNQAYSSTRIEYSIVSYNAAQKVIFAKKAHSEIEREVLNIANAHLAISSELRNPVTDKFIIGVHTKISDGLKGSLREPSYGSGKYRKIQNYLGELFSDRITYTFPDPKDVPKLMKKLNGFVNANKELDKLLIPGIFHFLFIAIHPFINGNGRTVRVIEDFLLKKAGYNLRNLYNLSRYYYLHLKSYHFFLNQGRDRHDLTDFLEFYLQGICEEQKNVFEEKKFLERMERLQSLPEWDKMDKTDKKLLGYAARNGEMSIKKAVKLSSRDLTDEAVRLRYQKYIALGILEKLGDYKMVKYVWKESKDAGI